MLSTLREKSPRAKRMISLFAAALVTILIAVLWIVLFDSHPLSDSVKHMNASLRELGNSVNAQIDLYKSQNQSSNLDSPDAYQAPAGTTASETDSSYGPDDSGAAASENNTVSSDKSQEIQASQDNGIKVY